MIKIFECKDKNYLNKLTVFLDKRRNDKNNNTKKVSLILRDIKKNKIKALIKYEKRFSKNKKINLSKNDINSSLSEIKKTESPFSKAVNLIGVHLNKVKPDILVVFGDRFEMFAGAISAYILRIPIVHIAGGEVSSGSLDEGFRHSITKLSSLHFHRQFLHQWLIRDILNQLHALIDLKSQE